MSSVQLPIACGNQCHTKVVVKGDRVSRDTVVENERLMVHCINHIGSRVSVDVLAMHLASLYDFMKTNLQGDFPCKQ